MTVLLTGNRGFVGKEVEKNLNSNGIKTIGYDIADNLDILNIESLTQKASGCDAIIHLAAIETQSPYDTMHVNVLGTWNVLWASVNTGIKKVIYISSTDALGVFQGEGQPHYLPLDDDYPCHPQTPYSVSKKLSEDMCKYFSLSHDMSIICLRPPGIWDDSTYLKICKERKKRPSYEWEPYWEYGAFIDIRDLAEVILLSLTKNLDGFNCFLVAADDITTSGMSSLELVNKLLPGVEWKGDNEYILNPFKSLLNTNNAKCLLSWIPKHSWKKFADGLKTETN